MKWDTIKKVRQLGPEAEDVVNWALRMEGALHRIEEFPRHEIHYPEEQRFDDHRDIAADILHEEAVTASINDAVATIRKLRAVLNDVYAALGDYHGMSATSRDEIDRMIREARAEILTAFALVNDPDGESLW